MKIAINKIITIDLNEDDVVSWSKDERTGIYTITMSDGSVWKYESEYHKFYELQ